jgi:ribosomal subunit interface protein
MQIPLQVTFRGLPPSDAFEARIRERASKLERFHGRITSCHVVVEAAHRHRHKGNLYNVRIDLRVPGGELVVSREPPECDSHQDPYVALRDAFDAAVRQLEDHLRRQRGKVKNHEIPAHGRVLGTSLVDGYGFLETPEGVEVYFHENAVVDGSFAELAPGSQVRFVLAEGEGEQGPQASSVQPVGKHHIVG